MFYLKRRIVEVGGDLMKVTASNLQNNFVKYLRYVEKGETIIITENSKDVATLEGVSETSATYAFNKITYEEFIEIDDGNRYEYIYEAVHLLSSPSVGHQYISGEIYAILNNYFKDKPCIPFAAPFDVTLYVDEITHVVQPDLLVVCDVKHLDGGAKYNGIPSLVIEILSPSTSKKDMFIKSELYSKAGINEYWIVDPESKKILLYNYLQNVIEFVHKGEKLKSSLFSKLSIDTNLIFEQPWEVL
jgi:prevent-host-death family protein